MSVRAEEGESEDVTRKQKCCFPYSHFCVLAIILLS